VHRSADETAFPNGARFAFTVVDDTDVATLDNVRPVYDLLTDLGLRTTKTVWTHRCPDPHSSYRDSDTLEDDAYRAYILELKARGFEITWHGPSMESSTRAEIEEGLRRLRDWIGVAPRVHVNHAHNRDNLYWGVDRLDQPFLRWLYRKAGDRNVSRYEGHREGTPHYWGDLASEVVEYSRNLTFTDLNILRVNPTTPYKDPRRPLVKWWFSAADADNAAAFNTLVNEDAQDALEADGGVAIVATHFGKGFANAGRLNSRTAALLARLAAKRGWFVPVSTLLDHLRSRHERPTLAATEWRRMQWRWAWDLVQARFR